MMKSIMTSVIIHMVENEFLIARNVQTNGNT